jgi:hypothetical protein
MDRLLEVEQQGYNIELTLKDGNFYLTNAADSLNQYVEEKLGGFGIDNMLTLVDSSGVLGYTLNKDLEEAVAEEYGFRFVHLATNRDLKLDPSTMFTTDNFTSVLDYAVKCGRTPVYVFEPDLSGRMLTKLKDYFGESEVVTLWDKWNPSLAITGNPSAVHTVKPVTGQRIPLLISSAGMIYSGEKDAMFRMAEKVVYCTAEVYNKRNTKKVKNL